MSHWKAFGLAIFAAVCLLGETGSAHVQCNPCATEWSDGGVINLGGLPGSTSSSAVSINNAGQAVGSSAFGGEDIATEWSGGSIIRLEGSTETTATGINNSGLVVGYSFGIGPFVATATEWIGGSPVYLQNLPGAH
jgi:uncharacterized membrane protein